MPASTEMLPAPGSPPSKNEKKKKKPEKKKSELIVKVDKLLFSLTLITAYREDNKYLFTLWGIHEEDIISVPTYLKTNSQTHSEYR